MFCCKIKQNPDLSNLLCYFVGMKELFVLLCFFFIFAFETGVANTIHMGFMDWGSKCQSLLCSLHFQEIRSHKKTCVEIFKLD